MYLYFTVIKHRDTYVPLPPPPPKKPPKLHCLALPKIMKTIIHEPIPRHIEDLVQVG